MSSGSCRLPCSAACRRKTRPRLKTGRHVTEGLAVNALSSCPWGSVFLRWVFLLHYDDLLRAACFIISIAELAGPRRRSRHHSSSGHPEHPLSIVFLFSTDFTQTDPDYYSMNGPVVQSTPGEGLTFAKDNYPPYKLPGVHLLKNEEFLLFLSYSF